MKILLSLLAPLALLTACDEGDHGHEHGPNTHTHGDEAGHDHAAPEAAPEVVEVASAPPPATDLPGAGPQAFQLGAWTATLSATDSALSLSAVDEHGEAVTPFGEIRVVLTGTGEDEQRVVLAPEDAGWTGAAKAAGASGYTAVVGAEVGGQRESARVTWGEVPAAKDHGHGDDGHGHDHGEGGHSH